MSFSGPLIEIHRSALYLSTSPFAQRHASGGIVIHLVRASGALAPEHSGS